MKPRLVGVDSGVTMFLVEARPADKDRIRRWAQVLDTVRALQDDGSEFIVPAPVISELHAGGEGQIADRLVRSSHHIRIEAFDDPAAVLAGKMTSIALKTRAPGTRAVVKFDAMILATAIECGCDTMLTTDPKDFGGHLNALVTLNIDHSIRVVDATSPVGQLAFIG